MSAFKRSVLRNCVIGTVIAFLTYVMYGSVISDIFESGYTAYGYTLLITTCTTCFAGGFISWSNHDDPGQFKYLIEGGRIVIPLTMLMGLIGLITFGWVGIVGGFALGLYSSVLGLKIFGPSASKEGYDASTDHENEIIHYYFLNLRIPVLTIAPLAFAGMMFFDWWGLGAGFIGGGLISTLALTLWGPSRPTPPVLAPDHVVAPAILPSVHHVDRSSRRLPPAPPHGTHPPIPIPPSKKTGSHHHVSRPNDLPVRPRSV